MNTLTPRQLGELLLADTDGTYTAQAAVRLLVEHETWLHRPDFVTACVNYDHHGQPVAWVDWPAVPAFADRAPCSTSEAAVLRLAAELAGMATHRPLDELLTGYDDHNARIVLAALTHVLTRGGER